MNRKIDPPRADLEFHLVNDIQRLARTNLTDWSQTVRFLANLESRRREFQTETGSVLDPKILARILGSAMDEDTVGRLEDAKVSVADYEKTRVWIESREKYPRSRNPSQEPSDSISSNI